MNSTQNLNVKIFADGADKDAMIDMYNKEYIKTGLRSKEAIVYWRVEWREKTRSQEVHVGYNGNLTEQDYRVLTDITGIKIEDGKYVGPGERK